ncbi:protocatechuate 3,4-dioxygenase subunit alpha [Phenylobacterium sp.]|uniref:protocatechuate 3,4-dioxygenase subunit alpha n=1 Tax=Phenylobacterium sp. TaxID=1871053 RepID=UPI0025CF734F|nr:protocatechuate 3,4-dioxygenase subunit alpha [Phenylobacterium sp.]
MRLGQTPWQTVGPFFHYALPHPGGADLTAPSEAGARPDLVAPGHAPLPGLSAATAGGEAIVVQGRVVDGAGAPVPDALVEIWQADAQGGFAGGRHFGRCATGDDGSYLFRTIRPGRTPGPGNSLQAPHIAVGVMGRGLLRRLVTRIYFADDPSLDEDPILALVPPERRGTLLAAADGAGGYRLDLVLQGPGETVFFDI